MFTHHRIGIITPAFERGAKGGAKGGGFSRMFGRNVRRAGWRGLALVPGGVRGESLAQGVAERYRDVASPARVADAADR